MTQLTGAKPHIASQLTALCSNTKELFKVISKQIFRRHYYKRNARLDKPLELRKVITVKILGIICKARILET